jgi:hypothetical protein
MPIPAGDGEDGDQRWRLEASEAIPSTGRELATGSPKGVHGWGMGRWIRRDRRWTELEKMMNLALIHGDPRRFL